MSKIRVDARTMALSHPTRRSIYEALLSAPELSTVMLQKQTEVTRYHLYHHLQSLVKNGLVENHRDEGRARWWKVTERVDLSEENNSSDSLPSNLPDEVLALLQSGAALHYIPIPRDSRDIAVAKQTIERMSEVFDVEKPPFSLMPNGILIIGPPRRS
ncbi:MAG: helix-turn-helix domain-containing protein [Candidatus Thermoplasmatota archaeon]|nr:hypothetical protein [Euryarchaeota archaeon]MEC7704344.1 helix-turn-helix domain-containing protein [Candidatus Thermoplasmatota archaeon]MEC9089764.1 helix-turn-helix domain-containing protein [Candidatus Thermoplasmatota archaeon]MED5486664.1 helix-turn-helix domain-containing protein [Candidatus Thermoplasmatota archaeon]|tara:strand:- start:422 stop:895 length:474 start_codon:yes stop_codon:yes gene_type:complete